MSRLINVIVATADGYRDYFSVLGRDELDDKKVSIMWHVVNLWFFGKNMGGGVDKHYVVFRLLVKTP